MMGQEQLSAIRAITVYVHSRMEKDITEMCIRDRCYTLLRKSSKLVSLEGMSEMTEIETDQRTDYSDLYRAVNSLKEELRMPVILYYIEDFNIKEIAQILEITEGAVQKRRARARGKLKRNLQESEELTV